MANEFLYQRGARRSAAPQYAPWTPPQSAANISAQSLAALLRQPQQAQQAPQQQQMQRRATEEQGDPGAAQMTSGPGPAQLTRLLQSLTADGNLNVEGQGDNQSMGNIGFNPNAGPMNPAIGRLLKGLTVFGLGAINPLAGAVANGIINNPDSETGVASSLVSSGLKRVAGPLGVLDTMRQIFGADSLTNVVDQQLQSLRAPSRETQAPAPVSDSVGSPVNQLDPTFDADAETLQQLLDQFNNYNANTGNYGNNQSWGGTNQSAGGTTDNGEGGPSTGGVGRTGFA